MIRSCTAQSAFIVSLFSLGSWGGGRGGDGLLMRAEFLEKHTAHWKLIALPNQTKLRARGVV